MRFEGRRRGSRVPNLTPLIDIVFLLLVFFMLTSHFVREQSIPIELPLADSGEDLSPTEQLEVVLNGEGQILLHEQVVPVEQLERELRSALASRSDKLVRIRGDRQAMLGVTVSVLDAARKAGAEAVDVVTEEK